MRLLLRSGAAGTVGDARRAAQRARRPRRRRRARWSAAEAALVVEWSAFAAGLLAVALARAGLGTGLLRRSAPGRVATCGAPSTRNRRSRSARPGSGPVEVGIPARLL